MNSQNSISFVFVLIIALLVGQGVSSFFYLNTIALQTENLYKHPYSVSNAARNININLISMHRYMKDIVLAENEQKIEETSALIDNHEQLVLKNFDLIFERYLGNRRDIEIPHQAFINWKGIRDQVIFLKAKGQYKDAADITRNKGAQHVALLNKEIQTLVDFADNKAKTFLKNAVDTKDNAFTVILGLLITTVIAAIFSSYYAVRSLNSAQREINGRMNLIDQNVLIVKLDTKGVVLEISNELCRYLGTVKNDMLGKQVNFFITDTESTVQPENILNIASTGKSWEGEIKRIDKEGRIQWIHSHVHPELDEDYQVVGYINIINDISDRMVLEELSITDHLTGLYNRRKFEKVLEKQIKIAHRSKSSLILAIVDIDFFKKYNDCYGHPLGDVALISVAQLLKKSLRRPTDNVFRLGGEEFGILVSDLDTERIAEFFETIKNKVEALTIEHKESEVSKFLTLSIGVFVNLEGATLDSNQLYIKADEALYVAKKQRNSVVVS